MLAITGLEFAYSQTPACLKSTVTAVWYATLVFYVISSIADWCIRSIAAGLGNLLVAVVALIDISNKVWQFLLFALLMSVMVFIFAVIVYFYEYKYYDSTVEEP